MEHRKYNAINQSVRKKDSRQLLLGKPVYVDDLTGDALVVKLLRSPHANAVIDEINTSAAKKVPGVVNIYTWEDVPQQRFAIAGQTYPEPSPYDRLIMDRHVRFSGDVVAIIAAEDEKSALKAMKLIKVKYKVLDAVLDFHKAKDSGILVHPEEDWFPPVEVGGDPKRNLVASETGGDGDVDAVIRDCEEVLDHTYHMKSFNQAMMETFRTYTGFDRYREAACDLIHPDRFPRAQDPVEGAWHSKEQDPGGKATDRWRLWSKADGSQRGVSCICDAENRASGKTGIHEKRKPDRRFTAA